MRLALQRLLAKPRLSYSPRHGLRVALLEDCNRKQANIQFAKTKSGYSRLSSWKSSHTRIVSLETDAQKASRVVQSRCVATSEGRDLATISPSERNHSNLRWEELDYESNVAATDGKVRLVDVENTAVNWRLWITLLQFRRRVYGTEGVVTIWKGIKIRNINLPTDGVFAKPLWSSLNIPDLKLELWKHALELKERDNVVFRDLYELLMGNTLLHSHAQSYRMHKWFTHKKYPIPPTAMAKLVPVALHDPATLKQLQKVYLASECRNIYDLVIPGLHSQGRYHEAIEWHRLLCKNLDHPSANLIARSKPIREFITLCNTHSVDRKGGKILEEDLLQSLQRTDKNRKAGNVAPQASPQQSTTYETDQPFSREAMNHALGLTHGINPRPLDDSWCARLFATRAFSVDFVISVLSMMGVEQVGPVALRELAVRASSPHIVLENIDKLRSANISLHPCVFSQSVEKFARENRSRLLEAIMTSDQHPDVYEDQKLLKTLLSSYVQQRNWGDARRILIVLTAFHSNPSAFSWNLLVQAYARTSSLRQLAKALEDMRMHNVMLNEYSIASLCRLRFRRRNWGHKTPPATSHDFDELTFMSNTWRLVSQSGGMVPAKNWRELIRRYGMSNRLDSLSRLCHWLVEWYSPKRIHTTSPSLNSTFANGVAPKPDERAQISARMLSMTTELPQTHPSHPFGQIFDAQIQRAIVTWGFQTGFRKQRFQRLLEMPGYSDYANSKVPLEPLRGLYLLHHLWREGVLVHTSLIRKVVKQRLVILFGPGISNRRANRRDRALNRYSLEELVIAIEHIWDWKMFGFSQDMRMQLSKVEGSEKETTEAEQNDWSTLRTNLLLHIYGSKVSVNSRRRQTIDTRSWAKWLKTEGQELGKPHRWDRSSNKFIYVKAENTRRWLKREEGKFVQQ